MVVVKGIGIISALGEGKEKNLAKIKQGQSGIKKVSTQWGERLIGEAEDFFIPEGFNSMPRLVQFGYIAIKEAMEEAGLTEENVSSPETGFIFSSSKGDLSYLEKGVDKYFWQNFLCHGASSSLAGFFKLRGPVLSIVSACASGATILARGAQLLLEEDIKRVIVCACEVPLNPFLIAGYEKMGVLSHSQMRPFDKKRDGFALGEGGVCIILEREGKGIGAIAGYSLGSDRTSPYRFDLDGDTLAHCLKKFSKRDFFPDYINTHGTATLFGDLYETLQIKKAFGPDAYKIPISSTKSMTGHLLGASGLLEFGLTILCLRDGFIPLTVGLREEDPDCDLNYVQENTYGNFHKFLVVSYGFGGSIACIAAEV